MGLFNVKSLLESESREMMGCNNSYKDNYIHSINCLGVLAVVLSPLYVYIIYYHPFL